LKTQLNWELNDHLNLLVFMFGSILTGITFHIHLLERGINFSVNPPTISQIFLESMRALGLSFPRLAEDIYTILVITGVLLSSLTLRYDKDTRLAMSIYSLPVKNYKLVLTKFIASFILLFLSVIIPFFLTLFYTYGDAPNLLKGALFGEGFFISYFMFWLLACVYVISLSSLIAELSPNLFASLLGGITLLYLPKILNITYLPPAVLNSAFLTSQTAFGSVAQKVLMLVDKAFVSCILIPLVLLGMTLLISEWRDVV